MANRFFSVQDSQDGAIYDGNNKLNSNASSVYRGMLAGYPSGGSLGVSTGSAVYGQFNDYLRNEEYPTTQELATYLAGKEINVVTGRYLCVMGADCFSAGAVPAVGTTLYPGTAGLIDTAENWPGVGKIGRVLRQITVADYEGGGSFTAAECIMDLPTL